VDEIRIPDPSEPAAALASVVALRRLADQLELAAAQSAMTQGWTWQQIAEALGVSRQAVHKKLAHRIRH
jgi:transcriptional regulator of acetoin/glycerol metabolism